MIGLGSIQTPIVEIRKVPKSASIVSYEEVHGVILLNIYVRLCGVMHFQQVPTKMLVSGVPPTNKRIFQFPFFLFSFKSFLILNKGTPILIPNSLASLGAERAQPTRQGLERLGALHVGFRRVSAAPIRQPGPR